MQRAGARLHPPFIATAYLIRPFVFVILALAPVGVLVPPATAGPAATQAQRTSASAHAPKHLADLMQRVLRPVSRTNLRTLILQCEMADGSEGSGGARRRITPEEARVSNRASYRNERTSRRAG